MDPALRYQSPVIAERERPCFTKERMRWDGGHDRYDPVSTLLCRKNTCFRSMIPVRPFHLSSQRLNFNFSARCLRSFSEPFTVGLNAGFVLL